MNSGILPTRRRLDGVTFTIERGNPIAMLNLLHYDCDEGQNEYGRYAQIAADTSAEVAQPAGRTPR